MQPFFEPSFGVTTAGGYTEGDRSTNFTKMGRNCGIAIGIDNYYSLRPLRYARQDAEAFRQFCLQEANFEQVYFFAEGAEPIPAERGSLRAEPTIGNLERFLRVRFEESFLEPGDNLWFFFAGHGKRSQGRDCLMPIDGDSENLNRTGLAIRDIADRLRRSGADNVLLFLDACRSEGSEGDRDGEGIGLEKQQGVITFFSCSPSELSYEIEDLRAGSFTHALLEGLRLRGKHNCDTVERLDQRLRYRVPELNRSHGKPLQTPYAIVEPASKYHLILLPRQATAQDAETLKLEAYRAERAGNNALAEKSEVQIFLAHASEDKPQVRTLYGQLREAGYRPWLDEVDLLPGQLWREEISKALRRSDFFIACLSQQSIAKQGYIQREFRQALNQYAERPPGSIYFIPLKFDNCDVPDLRQEEYGIQLKDIQWLNYWLPNGFKRLVQAIEYQREQSEQQKTGLSPADRVEVSDLKSEARAAEKAGNHALARQLWIHLSIASPGDPDAIAGIERLARVSARPPAPDPEPPPPPAPARPTLSFTAIVVDARGNEAEPRQGEAEYRREELGNGITLDLMRIPAGEFLMGSPEDEEGRDWYKNFDESWIDVEGPQHRVKVSAFWMGKCAVTQAQWRAVASLPKVARDLKTDPAKFKGDNRPVEQVS